jgi:hypothetical protein
MLPGRTDSEVAAFAFPEGPVMRPRLAWPMALLLFGCRAATTVTPAPSGLDRSPYRQPGESAWIPPADEEAAYLVVLKFYRPAGDQVRWFDPHLLPAAPVDTARSMDPQLVMRLMSALASLRFCLEGSDSSCTGRSGGVIRVSSVYGLAPDRARIIADFRGVAPAFAPGSAYSGTETFLLSRHDGAWKVQAHGPAAVPPSPR